MVHKITSILKNKKRAFVKKAESLMLLKMTESDIYSYKSLRKDIEDLNIESIDELEIKNGDLKIMYCEELVGSDIVVFDAVKELIKNIDDKNEKESIKILSKLNNYKISEDLMSKTSISNEEFDNKINSGFLKKVVMIGEYELFKQLIKEINRRKPLNQDPELMLNLMQRKIKREKENCKEKSKIRLIK